MNLHRIHRVALGMLLVVAFLLPQKIVSAQDVNSVEIPLAVFHDQKPIELEGLISSQRLTIPIPESWSLREENWIEIQVRASPLLDSTRSSLTISLNDLQLNSYRLSSIMDGQTRQQIALPVSMLTTGTNTLTFTSILYLPDDPEANCQTWDDPARWLTIDPTGLLHLSYQPRRPYLDLANFPQNFIDPLAQYLTPESKPSTLIVLPETLTHDDLSALSSISYVLGTHADTGFDWRPDIIISSEFSPQMAVQRNIIFIAEPPADVQDLAEGDRDYLALLPSPWSLGQAVLVVGDHDRQDGFSPLAAFSDPTRRVLLRGTLAYIDQPLASPSIQPFPNTISFEELGYLDRTVRGIGEQSLTYSLYIPYDVEPFLVNLHLGLALSPDLDMQNSSFTVYLNGFSVAGLLTTSQSSTTEPVTLGLPARTLRRGINYIRIRSDLHVPSGSCELALESVWATVLNSSTLEVTYRNRTPVPSLKDFPLPFSDNPGTAFVIPDHYSQEDLSYLSRLSFLLGSSSYYPYGLPQVLTASHFPQQSAEYPNVILVGLPSENDVTRSANDLLPQPFETAGNSLHNGYGIYLPTSDRDASLGLMQIMHSPWVEGGTVLVLSGSDLQGLAWAWDAILDPTSRGQFTGNVLLVGSQNRTEASSLVSQQVADVGNIPIIGSWLQGGRKAISIPVLAAIGIALFLIVFISWSMRWARQRKIQNVMESAEAEKDHEP